MFMKIEKDTRKVGVTTNEDKTKYIYMSEGEQEAT